MTTINQLLTEHRRSLLEQERHTASLEVRHNTGQPAETEIVNGQLEAHADAFTEECIADLDSPCECKRCEEYRAESMAYAMADYRPAVESDECECGGTYDEYDRCSDCANGHDDCEVNECFPCLERANDRAERMAEGMER